MICQNWEREKSSFSRNNYFSFFWIEDLSTGEIETFSFTDFRDTFRALPSQSIYRSYADSL